MHLQTIKDLSTYQPTNSKAEFHEGNGSPEGSVTAPVGAFYLKLDSPGSTFVKETGTGNTGWAELSSTSQFSTTIANDQSSPANVNGLDFDETEIRGAKVLYQIERRSDSTDVVEMGEIYALYDNENSEWKIKKRGNFDVAGVDFNITSGGVVQYTSDDLAGASYSGTLRVTKIDRILI